MLVYLKPYTALFMDPYEKVIKSLIEFFKTILFSIVVEVSGAGLQILLKEECLNL